jgi:hypothetical protein
MSGLWHLWRKTIVHATDSVLCSLRHSVDFCQLDYVKLEKKSMPEIEEGDHDIKNRLGIQAFEQHT